MFVRDRMRTLLETTGATPAVSQAVRGGLLWAAFLATGILTGKTLYGFQAGFLGWIVAFTDDLVGIWRRLGGAAVITGIAAVTTVTGSLAGASVAASVVTTAIFAFGVGLFVFLGPTGSRRALVIMFVTLFAVGQPSSGGTVIGLGVATVVGGMAGVLLIVMTAPFERHRRPGFVVARQYRMASEVAGMLSVSASDDELMAVRAEATKALSEAFADVRLDFGHRDQGAPAVMVGQASDVIRACSALSDVRSVAGLSVTAEILRVYEEVSLFCKEVAAGVTGPSTPPPDPSPVLAAVDVAIEKTREDGKRERGLGALRSLRRTVQGISSSSYADRETSGPARFGPRPAELIRANLGEDTVLRRHLFRLVVLLAASTLLYKVLHIPDGYFIPIGVNIMLQPDLGPGLDRVRVFFLGTVIGSVAGAALGVWLDADPYILTAVTALVLFAVTALTPITFWVFAVGISIFIVSALGLLVPGGWDLGLWRILDTVVAAMFTGAGLFLLWPSRGTTLIPTQIGHILETLAEYLRRAMAAGDREEVEDIRRRAMSQESALHVALTHQMYEPGADQDEADAFRAAAVSIGRLEGAITDVAERAGSDPDRSDPETAGLARQVASTIETVARMVDRGGGPVTLPRLTVDPRGPEVPPLRAELVEIGVHVQALASRLAPRRA